MTELSCPSRPSRLRSIVALLVSAGPTLRRPGAAVTSAGADWADATRSAGTRLHLARLSQEPRPHVRADRPHRRGQWPGEPVGDGPLLPDPDGGPTRARDARGL